jgi:hypothetical protein
MPEYLPKGPRDGRNIPIGSLPPAAVDEALALFPAKNRASMARAIALVGRKYTAEARAYAARIAEEN